MTCYHTKRCGIIKGDTSPLLPFFWYGLPAAMEDAEKGHFGLLHFLEHEYSPRDWLMTMGRDAEMSGR